MATLGTDGYRSNTRVYYAMQGVALGNIGATALINSWKATDTTTPPATGTLMVMHGLQSVGVDTNFNLEQVFELGQLSLYVNQEDVPDISVTTERVLDGYTLTYHAATQSAANATLAGRADARTDFRMVIAKTTDTFVDSGNGAAAELYCSGMYPSSLSYSLPTDGNFTESLSLVGNNKKWIADSGDTQAILLNASANIVWLSGVFGSDAPNTSNTNVLRRQNLVTGTAGMVLGAAARTFRTVVPNFITNVSITGSPVDARSGVNAGTFTTSATAGTHIQSINFSLDLGRESINQLGTFAPYNRYATFPVEVTTAIEVIAIAGDNIDAVETSTSNLSNHEISVLLDDSTFIHVGKKNKLSSVSYGGGDAGGGNATITYNMSNFNDFIILHSGDPLITTVGSSGYWKDYFPA